MEISAKTIFVVASLLILLAAVIWGLGDALIPLVISFGLAYLVFPLVKKLETKGIGRKHAVLAVFALFSIILIVGLVLVIPRLVSDAREFTNELPQITATAITKIESLSSKFGVDLDLSVEGARAFMDKYASEMSGSLVKNVAEGMTTAFSGISGWLISILNLFLVPLFFFYVINDFEKISAEIVSFIPIPLRPRLTKYLDHSNQILSGYIRGQLMVALVLGCLYAIGLSLLGLKFGFAVGMISGLISLIPYAGFFLGFTTAMMIGLANLSGFETIIGIAVLFIGAQILEGMFLTPKLVGDKVGLGSLATMLALIIGGNLFGITGMLVAIPVAAIAKAILGDLKQEYQQLDLYNS